ncbi:uncharacterized protein [Euphorbia lathyris]|uniref:uncharacterized protein n=1 Tax=Euphorbia lathyris TaxID=212925 RepID=UPI00331371CA
MRIRKNANLSSLMFSHASGTEPLQSHVCQLNQSPWDVIPFSQETYPSSLHQLEGEDSGNGNGSLGDSIGAAESNSFPSLMEDREEEKVDKMVIDDNSEMEEQEEQEEEMKIECDGKGWICRNEPKQGRHWMCEHHLKSYSNNLTSSSTAKKSVAAAAASSGRRGRAKAAKKGKSNSASNPYEFYYYSGFGPLWGKRRGGEIMTKAPEIDGITRNTTSSSVDHFEDLDFLDEDDDDEDSDNGESGKKRMRKPVKARSLKSLM